MKINDLKNKSVEELQKELHALLKEQFNLRMQKGSGDTPRTHSFKQIRRNIARIKTLLNAREK